MPSRGLQHALGGDAGPACRRSAPSPRRRRPRSRRAIRRARVDHVARAARMHDQPRAAAARCISRPTPPAWSRCTWVGDDEVDRVAARAGGVERGQQARHRVVGAGVDEGGASVLDDQVGGVEARPMKAGVDDVDAVVEAARRSRGLQGAAMSRVDSRERVARGSRASAENAPAALRPAARRFGESTDGHPRSASGPALRRASALVGAAWLAAVRHPRRRSAACRPKPTSLTHPARHDARGGADARSAAPTWTFARAPGKPDDLELPLRPRRLHRSTR